ncbi:MAG: 16S rRNA (guanine(966)-N(2))-methyltransferase RsmD [Dehalococcoidia bacterium]
MAERGPRVIGGSVGGIELRWPKSGATRPTTGKLREALFSMLEAAGASFDEVLDLYAGSGALGIEALSRGEGRATFVEADRRALAVVHENLAKVRFADRATVVAGKVGRWAPPPGAAYTLVLADPPYDRGTYDGGGAWGAIETTVRGSLAEDAVVVVEHDARQSPPPALAGLGLWRDRRHGAGAVAIYRYPADDATPEAAESEVEGNDE